MAYSESLADKIRSILKKRRGVTEKKMFGGLCFLIDGKMCCGVEKNRLVVRVGPKNYATLLKRKHVRPMDFTGRPLTGFVYVLPQALKTKTTLAWWIDLGLQWARSLPKK